MTVGTQLRAARQLRFQIADLPADTERSWTQIHADLADHRVSGNHRRQVKIDFTVRLKLRDARKKFTENGKTLREVDACALLSRKALDIDLLAFGTNSEGHVLSKHRLTVAVERVGIVAVADFQFK